MKKVVCILLAGMMLLGMAACGGGNGGESKADGSSVDMSKYPGTVGDWTGQNLIDYFKEAGIFTGTKEGDETWLQDHTTYWPGTPVSECAGYWTGDNSVMVMMLVLKNDLTDSSEKQYNEWISTIKETKKLPGDYNSFVVDHLVGNVVFIYSTTTLDEAVYNAMETAYQNWVTALKATPEF